MTTYLQTALEDALAREAPAAPPGAAPPAVDGYHTDPTGKQCAGGPQPGAKALLRELEARFAGRGGIYNCRPVRGGTRLSLHAEGRAVDWYRNVRDPAEAAEAQRIIDWLLAPDAAGNQHALARRMGIQEIIWNRRIWTARRQAEGWRAYKGVNPHTDHLHIGMNRAGAELKTSHWAPHAPAAPAPPAAQAIAGMLGDRASTTFGSAAEIDAFFRARTGKPFAEWFNATQTDRGAWARRVRNGKLGRRYPMRTDAETKRRFGLWWDVAPAQVFGQQRITLEQFVALQSILLNELAGSMKPSSEGFRGGRAGHPGLAYLFDAIEGFKKSYYAAAPGKEKTFGNRTALQCFDDPDFIAAHGHRALGAQLAHTTDNRWGGRTYPQHDFPIRRPQGGLRRRGRLLQVPRARHDPDDVPRVLPPHRRVRAGLHGHGSEDRRLPRPLGRHEARRGAHAQLQRRLGRPVPEHRLRHRGRGDPPARAEHEVPRDLPGPGGPRGHRARVVLPHGQADRRDRCLRRPVPAAVPADARHDRRRDAARRPIAGRRRCPAAELGPRLARRDRRAGRVHAPRLRAPGRQRLAAGSLRRQRPRRPARRHRGRPPGAHRRGRRDRRAARGRAPGARRRQGGRRRAGREDRLAAGGQRVPLGDPAVRQLAARLPGLLAKTRDKRAAAAGGEHGDDAVALTAKFIGGILASPGFSLHNDGRAIDLGTRDPRKSPALGPSTSQRAAWRASWLWTWLTEHAATYGYFQNTNSDEPWHWEYRGPATAGAAQSLATSLGAVAAGQAEIASVPLLAAHQGAGPVLVLRWNTIHDPSAGIDVVVHLHGFSNDHNLDLRDRKLPLSGLDFGPPAAPKGSGARAQPAWTGRTRPTLLVCPRGQARAGHPSAYGFPSLVGDGAFEQLVDAALRGFEAHAGVGTRVVARRIILTAHSGGGAALNRILTRAAGTPADPHEVHVFDALYGRPDGLAAWVRRRLSRDVERLRAGVPDARAQLSAEGGALRVFYTPGGEKSTQPSSLQIERLLREQIPRGAPGGDVLERFYRVERSAVGHGLVPYWYTGRLLADAAAQIGGPAAVPRGAP